MSNFDLSILNELNEKISNNTILLNELIIKKRNKEEKLENIKNKYENIQNNITSIIETLNE